LALGTSPRAAVVAKLQERILLPSERYEMNSTYDSECSGLCVSFRNTRNPLRFLSFKRFVCRTSSGRIRGLFLSEFYMHSLLSTSVHTHTYIHPYIRTYIHTYVRTYIRTYVHTYIRTYIHTYVRTYVRTILRIFIHS